MWTLEACLAASSVEKVIFSTDSLEYWKTVTKFIKSNRLQLSLRTPKEAGDKVKIFDYIQQNLDSIFNETVDRLLLALPTMPLRSSEHIEQAISLSNQNDQCGIFSAAEYEAPVSFAFSIEQDNIWHPLLETSPMVTGNTRSQDQKCFYHPNGAIYIKPLANMRKPTTKTFYQDSLPYLMSRAESVDIDTEFDFHLAESLLGRNRGGC